MSLPHIAGIGRVLPEPSTDSELPARTAGLEFRDRMGTVARMLIRGILAVVLFALACSALAAISLVAMYFDWRPDSVKP